MRRGVLSMVLGGLIASGAALGGGCGNSGVDFGTGPGTGGNGGAGGKATSTSTGGNGGHAPTSSTSTSSSSSSGASTSSSSSTSTTSTSSSGSSTSGGGCTIDPQDDACVKCSKQSCCAELVPCQNDQACVCWTGCLSQNPNNPGACAGCGPYDSTTSTFVNCAVQHCNAQCGGTSSSSTSSSSTGGLCAPAPGDSQCTTCAKSKCCNDVNACGASQSCICWVGCLAQGGSAAGCYGVCGVPDATTNALSQCSLQQCPGTCP